MSQIEWIAVIIAEMHYLSLNCAHIQSFVFLIIQHTLVFNNLCNYFHSSKLLICPHFQENRQCYQTSKIKQTAHSRKKSKQQKQNKMCLPSIIIKSPSASGVVGQSRRYYFRSDPRVQTIFLLNISFPLYIIVLYHWHIRNRYYLFCLFIPNRFQEIFKKDQKAL